MIDRSRLQQLIIDKTAVNPITQCWEWTGCLTTRGYAQIKIAGKAHHAHRVSAYLWNNFDIQSTELICHQCDNKKCLNPKHLLPGTPKQNTRQAIERGIFRTPVIGEDNPRAKLTETQVREIRILRQQGYRVIKLSKMYNMSDTAISEICRHIRWSHLA